MTNAPSVEEIAAEINKNRDNQTTENWRSFIFNSLLVVVGFLEAGALIFTIFVTNKAANAAKSSAEAAKGTLIAAVRPKIIVRKVEAVFLLPLIRKSL